MIVGGLVAIGVIEIDVNDMGGEFVQHGAPANVARTQKLIGETGHGVVLVVVVRDERRRSFVVDGLVIAIDVAEMPPAILVDDLGALFSNVSLPSMAASTNCKYPECGSASREVK